MTASDDRPWSRRVDPGEGEGGRPTPLSPGAQSEPLTYRTVQRPPGSEGQFRPRRPAPERADEAELPPTEALPTQDLPRYRPRDFSPEGRRAVPSWAPTGSSDGPAGERLDYHTLTRAEVRAATQRFSTTGPLSEDAGGSGGDASQPSSDVPAAGGTGAASGPPMSTPDQPLTRRQLRALREAQEAAERERDGAAPDAPPADDAPADGSTDDAVPPEAGERPAARPWAPVFYGEPVRPQDADPSAPAAEESAAGTDESAAPTWSGSAPATFAIPVVGEDGIASSEGGESRADEPSRVDAPSGDEHPAESGSLDAWVAGLYSEQPTAGDPAQLVEPPEPGRPAVPTADGAPSVLDDLFSPPTPDDSRTPSAPADGSTAAAEPEAGHAPHPVTDPLEFLDAAPSAADRVDLPAPSAWGQPPVVGQPPVEPPGTRAEDAGDAEPIPVEAQDVPPTEAADVHPVVLDAEPLPAEPLAPPVADAPRVEPLATPSGHWAAQASDDAQADVAAGRDVGGGHGVVTTNALVLPSIPSPELSGPLTTTGEIVITGSIDVPRSLSSTGAHPTQLDQSSLDHELDPGDQQVVSVDSQPVRAIKAVSTHTSTRGMMTSTKPHGNRGLTVLIIVCAGLAVVTLGVLALGLITNAF